MRALGIHYYAGSLQYFGILKIQDLFTIPLKRPLVVQDRVMHAFNFLSRLPHFLTKYDTFVFVSPPYFHLLAFPIFKLTKKRAISIVVDAYSDIAKEKLWQAPRSRKILRKLLYPAYALSEYLSIKLSDVVFCVSKYLVNLYKKLNKEIYYIPNGADVAAIEKIEPKMKDRDYIFYMGGFLQWRGIDLLIKAFENVRKKHDVKLVLVGGETKELMDSYPGLLELLGSKDVIQTGILPQEEAIAYLKGAKIAVMPSRNTIISRSISSIKVFQYIAAEIPQVCTDSGEHADWVRKLDVGIVVEDTVEGLTRGMLELLENEKLYEKFKENCRKRKLEIDSMLFKKPLIEYFESLSSTSPER